MFIRKDMAYIDFELFSHDKEGKEIKTLLKVEIQSSASITDLVKKIKEVASAAIIAKKLLPCKTNETGDRFPVEIWHEVKIEK